MLCFGVIHAMRPAVFGCCANAGGHVVGCLGVAHAHNGVLGNSIHSIHIGFGFSNGLSHHLGGRQSGVKLPNRAGFQEVPGSLVSFGGLETHDALPLSVVPDVADLGEGSGRHGQDIVVAITLQVGNLSISGDAEILEEFVGAVGLVLSVVRLLPDEERVAGNRGLASVVLEVGTAPHLDASLQLADDRFGHVGREGCVFGLHIEADETGRGGAELFGQLVFGVSANNDRAVDLGVSAQHVACDV